jgi:hypothetical protein
VDGRGHGAPGQPPTELALGIRVVLRRRVPTHGRFRHRFHEQRVGLLVERRHDLEWRHDLERRLDDRERLDDEEWLDDIRSHRRDVDPLSYGTTVSVARADVPRLPTAFTV